MLAWTIGVDMGAKADMMSRVQLQGWTSQEKKKLTRRKELALNDSPYNFRYLSYRERCREMLMLERSNEMVIW